MEDLEDKIRELKKSLNSLKNKQALFAPAIKGPSLVTPKLTSVKATKIPGGLPPASKKDPVKVADQLKNPRPQKPKMEVLKVDNNGQWSLNKGNSSMQPASLEATAGKPTPSRQLKLSSFHTPVSAAQHGMGDQHHLPEQNALIEGLDLKNAKRIRGSGAGVAGAAFAASSKHPHTAIVKNATEHPNRVERGHTENNFNSAKRELLYHNMARDFFDMGQHVPLTAAFTKNGEDWSAQKKLVNVGHVEKEDSPEGTKIVNPHHEAVLRNLHASGDIDKMTLMDHIMANHDRHGKNYMIDNKGNNLHLIDNGAAFDYKNFDPNSTPSFHRTLTDLGADTSKLHPEAVKWLNGLSNEKAKKLLEAQGYAGSDPHVKGFLGRLESLKNTVNKDKYKNVESMLIGNRLKQARMYPHKEP